MQSAIQLCQPKHFSHPNSTSLKKKKKMQVTIAMKSSAFIFLVLSLPFVFSVYTGSIGEAYYYEVTPNFDCPAVPSKCFKWQNASDAEVGCKVCDVRYLIAEVEFDYWPNCDNLTLNIFSKPKMLSVNEIEIPLHVRDFCKIIKYSRGYLEPVTYCVVAEPEAKRVFPDSPAYKYAVLTKGVCDFSVCDNCFVKPTEQKNSFAALYRRLSGNSTARTADSAPVRNYGSPAPSYFAPAPAYKAPSYSAIVPSYLASASSYAAPAPSYSAPAPINAPAPSYATAPSYAQAQTYAPTPSYEAPASYYGGYQRSTAQYNHKSAYQQSKYAAPAPSYAAPAPAYSAPVPIYAPAPSYATAPSYAQAPSYSPAPSYEAQASYGGGYKRSTAQYSQQPNYYQKSTYQSESYKKPKYAAPASSYAAPAPAYSAPSYAPALSYASAPSYAPAPSYYDILRTV